MKIGILKTVENGRDVALTGIGYAEALRALLRSVEPQLHFTIYQIADGDELPELSEYDGFLITGSPWGVYDEQPWIPPLLNFLQQAYQADKKLLGICFGHQILAHALGGRAEKSDKGFGLGVREYEVKKRHPWMQPFQDSLQLLFTHQDQVVELPEHAELLAGDSFCPIGMFSIGDTVFGFQGHPEFKPEHMASLIEKRRETLGEGLYQEAMESLVGELPDSDLLAHWMVNFLRA